MQDQWIGDTPISKGPGNFGLWRWCSDSRDGLDRCRGELTDFSTLLSPAFLSATVFTGLSLLTTCITVIIWAAFCFCRSVLHNTAVITDTLYTGLLQYSKFVEQCKFSQVRFCFISCREFFIISEYFLGVFLLVAILSFPAGWDNSSVVGVCGPLV